MCDIDGLLTTTRKDGNLEGHKAYYAKDVEPMKDLAQVVKKVKPSVMISSNYLQDFYDFIKIVKCFADYYWCICNARPIYTGNSSRYGKIQRSTDCFCSQ